MLDMYKKWVECNITDPKNFCDCATTMMVDNFPNLKKVRGYYVDPIHGKKPHWWCVDTNGTIVDPTVTQFNPCGDYLPYDETLGEPTAMCHYCGEPSYGDVYCCDDCRIKSESFMNSRK